MAFSANELAGNVLISAFFFLSWKDLSIGGKPVETVCTKCWAYELENIISAQNHEGI